MPEEQYLFEPCMGQGPRGQSQKRVLRPREWMPEPERGLTPRGPMPDPDEPIRVRPALAQSHAPDLDADHPMCRIWLQSNPAYWTNAAHRALKAAAINAAMDPPLPNFQAYWESQRPNDMTPQAGFGLWAGGCAPVVYSVSLVAPGKYSSQAPAPTYMCQYWKGGSKLPLQSWGRVISPPRNHSLRPPHSSFIEIGQEKKKTF